MTSVAKVIALQCKVDPDTAQYLRDMLALVEQGEVTGFTLLAQWKPVGNEPAKLSYWRSGLDDRSRLIGDLYMLLNDLAQN
jgi:hypothetical protein